MSPLPKVQKKKEPKNMNGKRTQMTNTKCDNTSEHKQISYTQTGARQTQSNTQQTKINTNKRQKNQTNSNNLDNQTTNSNKW